MADSGFPVNEEDAKLIVAIIKKGVASKVLMAAKNAGSYGGTILRGRGTAAKSVYTKILGVVYEPEKEIVLIAVKQSEVDKMLDVISQAAEISKPGNGIGFIVDLKWLVGIAHLRDNSEWGKMEDMRGELNNG